MRAQVYAGRPDCGKTTALLSWLFGGKRVESDERWWNRVLIVPTLTHLDAIKPEFMAMAQAVAESEDREADSEEALDFYHRVYEVNAWKEIALIVGKPPPAELQIAVDGLDMLLPEDALPGQLVRWSIQGDVDVRDPGQGMTLHEAIEHAEVADQRFRHLREAVIRLDMKPEGQVLDGEEGQPPTERERLMDLYACAGEYDWCHPGGEVLSPPAEETTGVAPFGRKLSKEELLAVLDGLRESLEADDSLEGSFAYELSIADDDPAGTFLVQAALRSGNSMGQGGIRLIRAGLPG